MTVERAMEIAQQLDGLRGVPIFVDSRETTRHYTAEDMKSLAKYFEQIITQKDLKIAIFNPHHFSYVKIFEKYLASAGFKHVAVFLDYEAAMKWIHPELDMKTEKATH